jgi:transcriptional regulator with XRE-family HTH domain
MQIHEKIEQARVSAGLTQDEVAEKIGVKRTTYAYWEQKTPGIDRIKQVADALDLPVEYFLDENFVKDDNTKPEPSRLILEESVLNLTATQKINATSIDRLVALLEKAFNSDIREKADVKQPRSSNKGASQGKPLDLALGKRYGKKNKEGTHQR